VKKLTKYLFLAAILVACSNLEAMTKKEKIDDTLFSYLENYKFEVKDNKLTYENYDLEENLTKGSFIHKIEECIEFKGGFEALNQGDIDQILNHLNRVNIRIIFDDCLTNLIKLIHFHVTEKHLRILYYRFNLEYVGMLGSLSFIKFICEEGNLLLLKSDKFKGTCFEYNTERISRLFSDLLAGAMVKNRSDIVKCLIENGAKNKITEKYDLDEIKRILQQEEQINETIRTLIKKTFDIK
jgi:hypothetical protein